MQIHYRVLTKTNWAFSWIVNNQLEPVKSSRFAAPILGDATFKKRYGSGLLEDGTLFIDGEFIGSLKGVYVQIQGSETVGFETFSIIWTGIIPAEEFRLFGYDGVVKSAEQVVKAYSLGYLLDTRIEEAFVENAGEAEVDTIDHIPTFNRKTASGQVAGNRSENKYVTYIFASGDSAQPWTNANIVEYLLTLHQTPALYGGPNFVLRIPTALNDALDLMVGVFDFSSMTLRQALDALLSRSRGFGWVADVDSDGIAYIGVWSLLDADVTIGDITMPAHDAGDRVTVDMWDVDEHEDLRITSDSSQLYDKIVAKGSRIKTCCTFSLANSTLEKVWTTEQETAYKDAAKDIAGYDDLSNSEKEVINDKFRSTDDFKTVFSSFRVPRNWDWKIGEAFANPQYDPSTGILDPASNGGFWTAEKRFDKSLPFKEGFDYSGADAVDKNPVDSEPGFRSLAAFVKDSNDNYSYAEQRESAAATVRSRADEMGVDVTFRPRHMAALYNYDNAEPSSDDKDFEEKAVDYTELLVTAMVETDQILQLFYFGPVTESLRTLVIDLSGVELWYVTPGTIVDIDASGEPVFFGGSNNIIRDDRSALNTVMAAAVAWYGKKRNRLTIRSGIVETFTHIGMMIDDVNVIDGESSAGTTVTEISILYPNKGAMIIKTDYAELNFAAIHSAGAAGIDSIPTLKVAARKINTIQDQVLDLKSVQDKIPLRIETPSAGDKLYTGTITTDVDSNNIFIGEFLNGKTESVYCQSSEVDNALEGNEFIAVRKSFSGLAYVWLCVGVYEIDIPSSGSPSSDDFSSDEGISSERLSSADISSGAPTSSDEPESSDDVLSSNDPESSGDIIESSKHLSSD